MQRFSPRAIGGTTSRTLLVVDHPDAVVDQAVRAGKPLGVWPPDPGPGIPSESPLIDRPPTLNCDDGLGRTVRRAGPGSPRGPAPGPGEGDGERRHHGRGVCRVGDPSTASMKGVPLTKRGPMSYTGAMPDRITIFRRDFRQLPRRGRPEEEGAQDRLARSRTSFRDKRPSTQRAGLGLTGLAVRCD